MTAVSEPGLASRIVADCPKQLLIDGEWVDAASGGTFKQSTRRRAQHSPRSPQVTLKTSIVRSGQHGVLLTRGRGERQPLCNVRTFSSESPTYSSSMPKSLGCSRCVKWACR